MNTTTNKPDISLLVPVFNEAENIDHLLARLNSVIDKISLQVEYVFVNDGSSDNTLHLLLSAQKNDKRIAILDLSRNFGKEAALTAALDFCRGRAAIPIDADLQDPPEILPELIEKWNEGYEVVNAVRRSRREEGFAKRFTAFLFYRFIGRLSETPIPPDTGDFRLLSRPVIEALKRMPERRRFMKGIFAWVGFKTAEIYYDRPARIAGSTSWNYFKLANFAIEGLTSFSAKPLRWATYLGILTAIISLVYAIVIVLKTLLWGEPVAGYPSLMVVMLFLGAVQLVSIGIIGEYLGRVYEETKQRPVYLTKAIYE